MAVLDEKTIGGKLFQTGNFPDPTHDAPKGTVYIAIEDGTGGTYSETYVNNGIGTGATQWSISTYSLYGGMYIQNNTIPTTVTTGTWTNISNLTFTGIKQQAITLDTAPNAYRLIKSSNYPIIAYEINLQVTIAKGGTSGVDVYEVGLSKNGAAPGIGEWGGATVSNGADSKEYDTISLRFVTVGTKTDNFSIVARRVAGGAGSNTLIIRNAVLFVNKFR